MTKARAAVDIGTHSTRILIGTVKDGKVLRKLKHTTITRLGDGLSSSGTISSEASGRVLQVLREYAQLARSEGAEIIKAVATSALRDASNSDALVSKGREILGTDIEIITGEEEGETIYQGAVSEFSDDGDKKILVFDIGGGSTEFIWGDGRGPQARWSVPAGCLRMRQRYLLSDPPSKGELKVCRRAVLRAAHDPLVFLKENQVELVIATAGTPTALTALSLDMEHYDPAKVHRHQLKKEEVESLLASLSSLPLAQRKKLKGLEPGRADVIVSGGVILDTVMEELSLPEVTVSESDILEGILISND